MAIIEKGITESSSFDIDEDLVVSIASLYGLVRKSMFTGNYDQVLVQGGKFVEAVFHFLESLVTGIIPNKIGSMRNTAQQLENNGLIPTSLRIHIPRLLLSIYDLRSKSDGAHWIRNKHAHYSEAAIVLSVLTYVLEEISLYISEKKRNHFEVALKDTFWDMVPLIEFINGKIFINNPDVSARESILLLLYSRISEQMTIDEIYNHLDGFTLKNIRISLNRAAAQKLLRVDGNLVTLSKLGIQSANKIIERYSR